MTADFTGIDGFIFDLDGCVYEGDRLMPAAAELVAVLRNLEKKVAFLSNNSTHTSSEIARKLSRMGMETDSADVFVPTDLAGDYLFGQFGRIGVFALAGIALVEGLEAAGHRIVTGVEDNCDVVLVARDTGFTFKKLEQAARHIQRGAVLVATNPDAFHPGNDGYRVPETGALLASIIAVAGETVHVLGKPEPYLFDKCLARLGLSASRTIMVGDNPATDIVGAQRAGMAGIWLNPRNGPPQPGIEPWKEYPGLGELLGDISMQRRTACIP